MVSVHTSSSSVSDTANSKCASLSLTLPTGGVIIGNVMDLVAAQLAFKAGPLDQHVMADIVLKSLEAVIDLHKDYQIIHNSLSPPNLIISKSEDSELAVSFVGSGAQSIDLQEHLFALDQAPFANVLAMFPTSASRKANEKCFSSYSEDLFSLPIAFKRSSSLCRNFRNRERTAERWEPLL